MAGPGADSERGSALALLPAGFLVLVLLGALAVDSAVAYRGQQALQDTLAAAANDAAAAGLDDSAFYSAGRLVLDAVPVERAVCQALAADGGSGVTDVTVALSISGIWVRLVGTGRVDAVFGRALPGLGHRTVTAAADAVLDGGPNTPSPPAFPPPQAVDCP